MTGKRSYLGEIMSNDESNSLGESRSQEASMEEDSVTCGESDVKAITSNLKKKCSQSRGKNTRSIESVKSSLIKARRCAKEFRRK